ncbi:MAG: cell division protein FtsQ, partial [Gaiellaceae bacterium]|nr:cell division protein FtsQ [Gaiellaceae bacterium]
MAARKRSTSRTAVLPARRAAPSFPLTRLAPSGRSVLIGLALFALAVGGYLAARETSIFAVRTIEIRGGDQTLQAQVKAALAGEVGQSLMKIDGNSLGRHIAPLPGVRSFQYDRAFPNTLRIVLRPEQPVLVLRSGADAYLVASTSRVIRKMAHPRLSHLPRLYVARGDAQVKVGEPLPAALGAAATALAPLQGAPLPGGVRLVRGGKEELTLVLGSGLEVRLGDHGDLQLKLAIARRILHATSATATGGDYLDVSVPERP